MSIRKILFIYYLGTGGINRIIWQIQKSRFSLHNRILIPDLISRSKTYSHSFAMQHTSNLQQNKKLLVEQSYFCPGVTRVSLQLCLLI